MKAITTTEIIEQMTAAPMSHAQATRIYHALWDIIGRELSVGEEVDVPELGRFFTTKQHGRHYEDGDRISLPTVEPGFEPDPVFEEVVRQAVVKHPELFQEIAPEEEDDQEDEPGIVPESPLPTNTEEEEDQPKPERPLGRASQISFIDLADTKVEKDILSLLPLPLAKKYSAVPVELKEGVLTVAMTDPEDFDAVQLIRKETGLAVKPMLTSRDGLTGILDQYTGLQAELQEVIEQGDFGISKKELSAAENEKVQEDGDSNAPTAKIVGSLLKRAVREGASDVHIEPYEHRVVVRFRVDGILEARVELPKAIQAAIIARLKILASLKIDEQRLPQDGRFTLNVDHNEVDFRLSTIPVVFGEKVVMRILDKKSGIRELEEVGLAGHGLAVLQENIRRSHGMILVTGPTGSGKTTTLYAVLARLMSSEVNIVTLEDPVEYRIESINQSQVHTEIGYSFAQGLRSIVRQDPDIVMLGEIRDTETAEMAVQAALTGHVVLSTLHTNDAAGAFPRLIDMGVEPFLIISSVHTVIAQRLARALLKEKRIERTLTPEELAEVKTAIDDFPTSLRESLEAEGINLEKPTFYTVPPDSGRTGYDGRIGIFEVLNVTEPIRSLILRRAAGGEIRAQAQKEGLITMVQDGIVKALRGQTTLEEVWRVTRE